MAATLLHALSCHADTWPRMTRDGAVEALAKLVAGAEYFDAESARAHSRDLQAAAAASGSSGVGPAGGAEAQRSDTETALALNTAYIAAGALSNLLHLPAAAARLLGSPSGAIHASSSKSGAAAADGLQPTEGADGVQKSPKQHKRSTSVPTPLQEVTSAMQHLQEVASELALTLG